jgi:hypothetical protein
MIFFYSDKTLKKDILNKSKKKGKIMKKNLLFIIVILFLGLESQSIAKDADLERNDMLGLFPPGDISFRGQIGAEIDRVINTRILSYFAEKKILPEAVNAFRTRVDDRFRPDAGVWQGEFWGKWMLSAVAAQRYTDDEHLKAVIRKGVEDLLATQDDDGYIGTYYDPGFVVGSCWNVWCQKYTLWGLLDAYELLGDPEILTAASRFMDHLMTLVGPGKIDIVKTGKLHGQPSTSILTPVIKLYEHTKDKRYLQYARYIVGQWSKFPDSPPDFLNKGLTGKPVHEWFPEIDRWAKAYEFISNVEGLLYLYRVDKDDKYLQAAKNIYEAIRQNERVITGGIGHHDRLDRAAFHAEGLNEPCDVVYWQRLSTQLLRLTGESHYADEIERLTYNVLMASMNRDGSWGVRRLGLSEPHLISPLHSYTYYHHCCVANVPRGMLQLAETALMTSEKDNSLVVNLYSAATADVTLPSGDKIAIEIDSNYPESGTVNLYLTCEKPISFPLKLRIPPWSLETRLKVNGNSQGNVKSGSYATIKRTWKRGDRVELQLDIRPRVVELPDSETHMAVMRGPVVLARSELLEDNEIHEPVELKVLKDDRIQLKRTPAPEGVWMAFEAATVNGDTIHLCDYASTGKDYEKPDDPYAQRQMMTNRTDSDLRVWLAVP